VQPIAGFQHHLGDVVLLLLEDLVAVRGFFQAIEPVSRIRPSPASRIWSDALDQVNRASDVGIDDVAYVIELLIEECVTGGAHRASARYSFIEWGVRGERFDVCF